MSNRRQNLIGKRFGHLTVIAKSKRTDKYHSFYWVCQCDCGKILDVTTGALNSGNTTSCGHASVERIKQYHLDHAQEIHLKLLNDKPRKNNKSGYKNIRKTPRKGKDKYQVLIVWKRKQHSATCSTLRDALIKREELRAKYWPNYQAKSIDEVLKEGD